MCIRLAKEPIPTFPSYLDPVHIECLIRLGSLLATITCSDQDLKDAFHTTILTLTRNTPTSQLRRINESLFLRFELLHSLRKDGSFIKAKEVTHNIGALRWALRVVYLTEYFNLMETLPSEERKYELE
jgi:hypothetical protein